MSNWHHGQPGPYGQPPYNQPPGPIGPYGGQPGPYGQQAGRVTGGGEPLPPAGHYQAPAYAPYNQPGGPTGPYGRPPGPYYQPQMEAPGNWGPWPPAGPNQAPAYGPYSQPEGGPSVPYGGQTTLPPQQHGQNSMLGMPPGHQTNAPSSQNQQKDMWMKKGSGQTGGQRNDHRGQGRGHGRIRDRNRRNKNNTDEKKSEVSSQCGNDKIDESEEDCSDSEDAKITKETKPGINEFKMSTDSLNKDKTGEKIIMQDPGNQTAIEPTEPPEENEVFEHLIRRVGGPISVKDITAEKLFPEGFDIPGWFRSHQRFIMFENKEKNYQFIVPFFKEATFCLDYNQPGRQEKCDQSDCPHAHICKNFIDGCCKQGEKCSFSHNFCDQANAGLISKLGLNIFINEEIRLIYSLRFPHVCGKHTPTNICRLPACAYLHICINNLFGKCENGSDCKLRHTFETEQNKNVIKAYQLAHRSEASLKKVIFLSPVRKKGNTDHDFKGSMPDITRMPKNRLNIAKGPKPKKKSNNEILKKDAAEFTPVCDLNIVDSCKTATCKYHHHDSIKLPYIWQIQIFLNLWLTLDKQVMIKAEKAFCKKKGTIQTSFTFEGHIYDAKSELNTMTAVVTDRENPHSTINTKVRRLTTESYAIGAKLSAEDNFKTQWRWFFTDDLGKICLVEPELLQFTLEQKFTANCQDRYMFFRDNYKLRYRIDFRIMEQIIIETGEVWKLLRRPLFVSEEDVVNKKYPEKIALPTGVNNEPLPDGWAPWDLASDFELVELKKNAAEFKKVECSFLTTFNPSEVHISYIYRVQNRKLWMAYEGQKRSMQISLERTGQIKQVDERNLFHGTNSMDTVQGICTNCFDFRVSGKHGTRYGKGAYFARDAKYSHAYTTNSSNTADRYMFLAKVLVGEYTAGSPTFTRPPEKPGGTAHQLFDSCVDIVDNPSIVVVFDLKQCYPEYLICYKAQADLSTKETSENITPSLVEQMQDLLLMDQYTEPKSEIHSHSITAKKESVLSMFDPFYSHEKLEEFPIKDETKGKTNKNARPLKVTRIQPSLSQEQSSPPLSDMYRSLSPVGAQSVSHLSQPQYSHTPNNKKISALINLFDNPTTSSSPLHQYLTDPPVQPSRSSLGASSSQFMEDNLIPAVPNRAVEINEKDLYKEAPSNPKQQVSIKSENDNRSPLYPKPRGNIRIIMDMEG